MAGAQGGAQYGAEEYDNVDGEEYGNHGVGDSTTR